MESLSEPTAPLLSAQPSLSTRRPKLVSAVLSFRTKFIIGAEPVLFLYLFGMFLQQSLTQQYVYNRFGQQLWREELNYTGQFNFCLNADVLDKNLGNGSDKEVTKESSYLSLVNSLAGQLPGIVAALLYGPLSDRIGRRPPMVVIAGAAVVNGALTLLLIHFEWMVEILPAISAVNGLTGGFSGMLTLSFAYTVDVSSKRWITLRLGILEAMIFVGGALATLILGQWLGASHCVFTGPMYLYLAANIAVLLYVLLWMPESLSKDERKRRTRNVPFCRLLTRGLKLFFTRKYSLWTLWLGLIQLFLAYFIAIGVSDISTLFLLGSPLSWDPGLIGLYQALNQGVLGITLLTLLPVLVACKVPDPIIILVGFGWAAAMSVATGFVRYTWQMFLVGALSGIEILGYPPIRSILSKAVNPEDQGALFSIVAAGQVFAYTCATVVFYFLLPWFTVDLEWPAGDIYYFTAVLCALTWPIAIVFLVAWWHKRLVTRPSTGVQQEAGILRQNSLDVVSSISAPPTSNTLYYGSTISAEQSKDKAIN